MERKVQAKNQLMYGVGINDADYIVIKGRRGDKRDACPFYEKWKSMLLRCYGSDAYKAKTPTYRDCYVCDDWLYFSNFKAWMETQDWEGKQLDKDLLVKGNKVYSPQTCCFLTRRVNMYLSAARSKKSSLLTGAVLVWTGRYISQCNDENGLSNHLGTFDTEIEAHNAWRAFKLDVGRKLASEIDNFLIANAVRNYFK